MATCKQMLKLSKIFKSFKFSPLLSTVGLNETSSTTSSQARALHSSACRWDLMEFFDVKKNWGEKEVKVGRSWKLEELRIKSNSDLHKLWFVLLKEKNMLLTMEHAAKEAWASFPNPERLDKVEESMENLETVVRERNKAYWELEVGQTGERPGREEIAFSGLRYRYMMRQHRMPECINTSHKKIKDSLNRMDDRVYQKEWLSLFREKRWAYNRQKRVRDFNHVCGLVKRFPNLDVEAVKQQYPDVDFDRARRHVRSRGHRVDNVA